MTVPRLSIARAPPRRDNARARLRRLPDREPWWTPPAVNDATAHWDIPDPGSLERSDTDRLSAFRTTYDGLERRVQRLTSLRIDLQDRVRLRHKLERIDELPRGGER